MNIEESNIVWNLKYGVLINFEVGIFKWCVVWLEFKLYQECRNFGFVKELVFDV